MSVFETVEPSLAWPKSARIGFYGLRQHRRPMPFRIDLFANLVGNFSQGRPWKFPSFFFRPWRPPRALLESSWRGSRAQEASKALPEASGVDFWRHFGSQNGAFVGFVRASVAWCFSLAFGQFVVRLSFCLKDVRAPRANGAHADYIVKTNGFKHIFKLCFRAGERRGEQNTHGSGKKTHAKTAPKNDVLVTFLLFFSFPPAQPPKSSPNDLPDPLRDPPGDPPGGRNRSTFRSKGVPRPPR